MRVGGTACRTAEAAEGVEGVFVCDNLRIIRELPDVSDAVEKVKAGIAVSPLAEHFRIRQRDVRERGLHEACIVRFVQQVVSVIKEQRHGAIVILED